MFRSPPSRSAATKPRKISTTSSQTPPSTTPPTPQPPTNQSAPTPTPPSRPSFVRRATPLLLGAGTGFFIYRAATDNEFRASVEKTFPASATLLNLIPTSITAPNKSVVETSRSLDSEGKPTLPPGYDTVPDLLRKIEESKVAIHTSENTPQVSDKSTDHQNVQPVAPPQHAVSTPARNPDDAINAPTDGPITPRIQDSTTTPTLSKASAIVTANVAAEAKPTLSEIMKAEDNGSGVPERASAQGTSEPIATGSSGKAKLAKVLGKGDFRTDQVQGEDVVDSSVYQKPKGWSSLSKPKYAVDKKRGDETPAAGSWSRPATSKVGEKGESGGSDAEILALRAELESQTKWEAVRLQEAVRAQMVEDKKVATKEAAEMARKHAEEIARVKEEALAEAQRVVKIRSEEFKKKAEAERDADLTRMLKAKEEVLREELSLEYMNKEREQAAEREKGMVEARAEVVALEEQFGTLVSQTEKAKEACKRASAAFMLRENVSSCRPFGKHLLEAGGGEELGDLVVDSVPEGAVKVGVQSVDSLRDSFRYASRRGLSVAMVPEGKTGTIWGHLLGAVFSRLKLPVDVRDDGEVNAKTNEGRIRLAGRLVEEGDIGAAIVTLEGLKGLSREIMADWVGKAKARVAADLAADALLADAIIAQLALCRGEG